MRVPAVLGARAPLVSPNGGDWFEPSTAHSSLARFAFRSGVRAFGRASDPGHE